ncbi:MAG: hypothetical protein P4L83_10890 [Nevskia sp.]|nr:hypothetical protein [Nevskia sp.]
MDVDRSCFDWPVFGLADADKRGRLERGLGELTRLHARNCEPYGRIVQALGVDPMRDYGLEAVPLLPVRLFKQYELKSVPDTAVFKVLTSSGTSSQQLSRVVLDRDTAQAQTRALVLILQDFLGKARLPMLILDHPGVIKDRRSYSARGAGILGLSSFGRDHVYALRDDMTADLEAVAAFAERHRGQRVLLFGFTFMVWKYFVGALRRTPLRTPLSDAILIHSGGWKKLQDEAVDAATFGRALEEFAGVSRVHNFYGMVEQVGSIFVECEHGRLHTPAFADVLIRDARSGLTLPPGQTGLIQALSLLPASYPGHSLLTEDLGEWTGVDDCPCGRLGRTFKVHGRAARTELRGCSDTHAAAVEQVAGASA